MTKRLLCAFGWRKLVALLCAMVPLIPLGGLFMSQHNCACGMSRDACICELAAARPGAHCDLRMKEKGECSMRSVPKPSGAILFVSIDLRGWLQVRSLREAGQVLAPAGSVVLADFGTPRLFSLSPEPPPPRIFYSA